MSANPGPNPEAAWRTATIVLVSLPLGVTMLVVVGLFLSLAEPMSGPPGSPYLVWVWLLLTTVTAPAAFIVWQRMVRPHVPPTGIRGRPPTSDEMERIQTGSIISMALIEGAALLGGVLLILGAGPFPALVGLAIAWAAFFLLRPRRGWYGLR